MTDDWYLHCPEPNPEWCLTPEEVTVWKKLHYKVTSWARQPRNQNNTVSCEGGKFRPEDSYG